MNDIKENKQNKTKRNVDLSLYWILFELFTWSFLFYRLLLQLHMYGVKFNLLVILESR